MSNGQTERTLAALAEQLAQEVMSLRETQADLLAALEDMARDYAYMARKAMEFNETRRAIADRAAAIIAKAKPGS